MRFTSVMLTFKEHPIARMMLSQLVENGHIPHSIIQEESSFGAKKKALYDPLVANQTELPTIQQLCQVYNIDSITVHNVNHQQSIEKISSIQPELILLGNTRIIKPEVFTLASAGCINIHPGLLPYVKGAFPQVWSILHDHPIGCTSHLIDEGVDTGPMINQQTITVEKYDTLDSIIKKTMKVSASLMLDAVKTYADTHRFSLKSYNTTGNYYNIPAPETIELARQKLKQRNLNKDTHLFEQP